MKPLTLFSFQRVVLLILTLLLYNTVSGAQDDPWIAVAVSEEIVIRPNTDTIELPVRITLEQVKKADVRLELQEVRFDKELGSELLAAFRVDTVLTAQGQLIVKFNLQDVGNRPGTYTLYIEATDVKKAKKRENITLKIKNPAATLQAIQTRVIERIGAFPAGKMTVNGMQLFLQESSGKSRLTDLQLIPKSFSDKSKRPVDVSLNFKSDSLELLPGSATPAIFELQGDFPLGKTEGQVEIRAPQLAQPVAVKFEVNTRLSSAWIIVVILIGIFLGWLLRQYLKGRIERSEALLAGIKVRGRMIEALEQLYPDRIFQDTMVREKDTLNAAMRDGSIEQIEAATTKAEAALKAAITELEGRRTTQGTRIGLLQQMTNTPDLFPKNLALILEQVRMETQKAATFLEENRIVACKEKIDQIKDNLLYSELEPWWKHWKANLTIRLKIDRLQPKPVLDYVQGATGDIATVLNPLGPILPSTTVEEYHELIDKVLEIRSNLRGFITGLKTALELEKEATIGYLNVNLVPNLPAPEAIENLKTVAAQQLDQLSEGEPEETLKLLGNADWLTTFNIAWEAAVFKQSNKANVQKLIDSGQYTQAAMVAAENLNTTPANATTGAVEGFGVQPKASSAPGASPLETIAHSTWQYTTADNGSTRIWVLPPFFRPLQTGEIPDEQTLGRIQRGSTAAQNIISAVLLIAIGYILFQEDFVGTTKKMIEIGLWAFGLDITVDKVAEQIKAINR